MKNTTLLLAAFFCVNGLLTAMEHSRNSPERSSILNAPKPKRLSPEERFIKIEFQKERVIGSANLNTAPRPITRSGKIDKESDGTEQK